MTDVSDTLPFFDLSSYLLVHTYIAPHAPPDHAPLSVYLSPVHVAL